MHKTWKNQQESSPDFTNVSEDGVIDPSIWPNTVIGSAQAELQGQDLHMM